MVPKVVLQVFMTAPCTSTACKQAVMKPDYILMTVILLKRVALLLSNNKTHTEKLIFSNRIRVVFLPTTNPAKDVTYFPLLRSFR